MSHLSKRYPIRICMYCNAKTHKKFWAEGKYCPVCEIEATFIEAASGGLNVRQIAVAKAEFLRTQISPETQMPAVERELG